MVKIGLISDPHATPAPLAEALALFREKNVDMIWCTGDIAGYGVGLDETVSLLKEYDCHTISGNHELWYLDKDSDNVNPDSFDYIKRLPLVIEERIADNQLYMVHASPPRSVTEGIHLLDPQGEIITHEKLKWQERLKKFEADVLIVGHTHQVFAVQFEKTLVINPGSTRFNHCCAVITLPKREVEWFNLSGEEIRYSWNWGSEVI